MAEPTKDSTGDNMQSAASRLAAFVRALDEGEDYGVPYEVRLAVFETEACVRDWTELRKADGGGDEA